MSEENIYYWKWKNTIIDFENISDEKADFGDYTLKKDFVFKYLGTPDKAIHEWKNGWYSSEYNDALKYAKELCLIEKYYDYDEELYEKDEKIENLKSQLQQKENIIKEVREYIKWHYDLATDENVEFCLLRDRLLEILDKENI